MRTHRAHPLFYLETFEYEKMPKEWPPVASFGIDLLVARRWSQVALLQPDRKTSRGAHPFECGEHVSECYPI